MNNRKTQVAPSFKKSVGAGFQSLVGAKGRTFFVLEIKTPTQKYKPGQKFTYTSDYVELGRSPKAALNFTPESVYVSRRHAAIQKEGNDYVIRNLSQTNPTLVNGQPVADQWKLQNGDEIQLAMEGPKIGFNTPPNNTAKSLPLSIRLQAFRQEVLRPFKTALLIMVVFLTTSIGAGGYFTYSFYNENEALKKQLFSFQDNLTDLETYNQKLEKEVSISQEQADKVRKENKIAKKEMQNMQKQVQDYSKLISNQKNKLAEISAKQAELEASLVKDISRVELVNMYQDDVYLIKMLGVTVEADLPPSILAYVNNLCASIQGTGTGFLLDDGRFVTARHVSHPWLYGNPDSQYILTADGVVHNPTYLANLIEKTISGAKVYANLEAVSPSGKVIKLTSKDFKINRESIVLKESYDQIFEEKVMSGFSMHSGSSDWAVTAPQKEKGKIKMGESMSKSLKAGEKIMILGYPRATELNDLDNIKISFSESNVAQPGLDKNGYIQISNVGTDQGNSGGPCFVVRDGKAYAVGIVSSGSTSPTTSITFVMLTPTGNIK